MHSIVLTSPSAVARRINVARRPSASLSCAGVVSLMVWQPPLLHAASLPQCRSLPRRRTRPPGSAPPVSAPAHPVACPSIPRWDRVETPGDPRSTPPYARRIRARLPRLDRRTLASGRSPSPVRPRPSRPRRWLEAGTPYRAVVVSSGVASREHTRKPAQSRRVPSAGRRAVSPTRETSAGPYRATSRPWRAIHAVIRQNSALQVAAVFATSQSERRNSRRRTPRRVLGSFSRA